MTFVDQWLEQVRKTSTSSTYKMAWAKAITHVACEYNETQIEACQKDMLIRIPLFSIAEKFWGYYWDQDVFFRLRQNSNPNKPSEMVSLIRRIEPDVFEILESPRIQLFNQIRHKLMMKDRAFYDQTVKEIVKILKQDVSYRFLKGASDHDDAPLYFYEKGADELYIKAEDFQMLKDHMALIFDVVNLRWIMLLEKYNNTPRIAMKVRHTDLDSHSRSNLKPFRKHLELENPNYICFECGYPIEQTQLAVDHVIPWSYMYSDDLWNLVFIHKSCNSKKSNTIPSKEQIEALKVRNERLLKTIIQLDNSANKMTFELQDAITHNLVEKFWIQCNG